MIPSFVVPSTAQAHLNSPIDSTDKQAGCREHESPNHEFRFQGHSRPTAPAPTSGNIKAIFVGSAATTLLLFFGNLKNTDGLVLRVVVEEIRGENDVDDDLHCG